MWEPFTERARKAIVLAQEEAQRLGRILRPKEEGNIAHFYSLVTKDTKDQEFAENRQRFLTEQGYRYNIEVYDSDGSPQMDVPSLKPLA